MGIYSFLEFIRHIFAKHRMNYNYIHKGLESAGVKFDAGLTTQEFEVIESKYDIRFPPDLREFLSQRLPVSEGWLNWREDKPEDILCRLNQPYEGICFDIEHNSFWLSGWGERPAKLDDCFRKVRELLNAAPKLIPIFSHRYIADRPQEGNNPVYSVHQTDIIYYGSNLENYFENEFNVCFRIPHYNIKKPVKKIEFWDEIIDYNNS